MDQNDSRRERKPFRKEYQTQMNNMHNIIPSVYQSKTAHSIPYYAVPMISEDCSEYMPPMATYPDHQYSNSVHANSARSVPMALPTYPPFIASPAYMPNGQQISQDSAHFKLPFYGYPAAAPAAAFPAAPAPMGHPAPSSHVHHQPGPAPNGPIGHSQNMPNGQQHVEMQVPPNQMVDMMNMINSEASSSKQLVPVHNGNHSQSGPNALPSSGPNTNMQPSAPSLAPAYPIPAAFPTTHAQPTAFLPASYLPAQLPPNAFPSPAHMIYFPVSLPPQFYPTAPPPHPNFAAHPLAHNAAQSLISPASMHTNPSLVTSSHTPPHTIMHNQYQNNHCNDYDPDSDGQEHSLSPIPPACESQYQDCINQNECNTQLEADSAADAPAYKFLNENENDDESEGQSIGMENGYANVHENSNQTNNKSLTDTETEPESTQSEEEVQNPQPETFKMNENNEKLEKILDDNVAAIGTLCLSSDNGTTDESCSTESQQLSVEENAQEMNKMKSTDDIETEAPEIISNDSVLVSDTGSLCEVKDNEQAPESSSNESNEAGPAEACVTVKAEGKPTTIKSNETTANTNGTRSWADLFKSNQQNKTTASTHKPNVAMETAKLNASDVLNNVQSVSIASSCNLNKNGNSAPDAIKNKQNLSIITSYTGKNITVIPADQDPYVRKLARKMKDYRGKHSLPFLVPRGFTNQGNFCYINATLQALLCCPPFYNFMRELGELPFLFRDHTCTPILDSFARFFTYFMPSEQMIKRTKTGNSISFNDLPRVEPFEPKCIYDVLGRINNECLKGKQEDAEEFLSSLLNALNEEILQVYLAVNQETDKKTSGDILSNGVGGSTNRNNMVDTDDKQRTNGNDHLWKEIGSRHKVVVRNTKTVSTPITEIFGGVLHTVRTAGKDELHMEQPFFTLQLDIQSDKVHNVQDALKQLTLTESIQDYLCPKTHKHIEASYQSFLEQLPPILILHVKLFSFDKNGGLKKLMKKLDFPMVLEMPRECLLQDRSRFAKSYKLLSVVYHEGTEATKGHYITDLYHIGTSLWLRCDDSVVSEISQQQLLHPSSPKTPYLLFYRRCDTLRSNSRA